VAFMSARINAAPQLGGTGLGAELSKAMFGDLDSEIALAKMRSQMANDAYQRQQAWAAAEYDRARTEKEQWELHARQGAVDPYGKIIYDAQGNPVEAPAPVEPEFQLPAETGAIPLPRMSDMPAVVDPVEAYRAGQTPREPFATIPPVSEPSPQDPFAQVPATAVLGQAPAEPLPQEVAPTTVLGQAPSDPFAQVAPVPVTLEPDVSFDTAARGPDQPFLRQLEMARQQLPGGGAASSPAELADWWRSRAGPDVTRTTIPGRETLMRDRPPPPSLEPVPVADETMADRQPPPSLGPQVMAGETMGDRPPPPSLEPVPVQGTDRPPPPSLEQQALPTGDVMRDRPPPVSPDYPIAANAYPTTATGDVMIEPDTDTVVVKTTSSGPVRLTRQEANAMAAGMVAQGGDVAGQVGKAAGLVGTIYDTGASPDQQRINSMLYTGNAPTTSTMITSEDTAPNVFEAQKAKDVAAAEALKPEKLKERVVEGKDGQFFQVGDDGKGGVILTPITPTGGAPVAAPVIEDLAPNLPGTAAEIAYLNTLADINEMARRGRPIDDNVKAIYSSIYNQLYGTKTSTTRDASGRQDIMAISPEPPVGMLTPEQLNAGGATTPAPATAAPAPAAATPAPAAATPAPAAAAGANAAIPTTTTQPAPAAAADVNAPTVTLDAEGRPVSTAHMSKVGEATIKNYGGWTGDGEEPPRATTREYVPGMGWVVRTSVGNAKNPVPTEKVLQNAKMLSESIYAAKLLDDMSIKGEIPNTFRTVLRKMGEQDSVAWDQIDLLFSDDESRRWARAIYTFINGQLRPDTGAAITNKEISNYEKRFVPPAGASLQDIVDTRANRVSSMRAIRMALNGQLSEDRLREIDTQMGHYGYDLDWTPEAAQKQIDADKAGKAGRPAGTEKKQTFFKDENGNWRSR